jgi:hypothetical protein
MADLIEKIKSMKNATKEDVDKLIYDYSSKRVIKDLKEMDIDPEELEEEEFQQLLVEEVNKNRTFSKGALSGMGALLVLDLLG